MTQSNKKVNLKILVCGSRNFKDKELMRKIIKSLAPSLIVEGEAKGADLLAKEIAKELGISFCPHPASWNTYGGAAGSIRNQEMLEHHPDLDLVLAFPLPGSKGTYDMINKAEKVGIKVLIFPKEPRENLL